MGACTGPNEESGGGLGNFVFFSLNLAQRPSEEHTTGGLREQFSRPTPPMESHASFLDASIKFMFGRWACIPAE